jgi:hypothetical protein
MSDVREASGVPVVADFASSKGTPIVVNISTGDGYILKSNAVYGLWGSDTDLAYTFNEAATFKANIVMDVASKRFKTYYSTTNTECLLFKPSADNSSNTIGVIPSGTGTAARFRVFEKEDADNSAYLSLTSDGSYMYVRSASVGTGTTKNLIVDANGTGNNLTITGSAVTLNHTGCNIAYVDAGKTVEHQSSGRVNITHDNASTAVVTPYATSGSYTGGILRPLADRVANSAYYFLLGTSDYNGTPDNEFSLRGDGNAFCDGSWSGGGADYAEYFEWADAGPETRRDRLGCSVVLDTTRPGKVRLALPDDPAESIIGIVSHNPSVVGNNPIKYPHRYKQDPFGGWKLDDNGDRIPDPQFNPAEEYEAREKRWKEWAVIGLLGQVRMRRGERLNPRWIWIRETNQSPDVDLVLIR